MSLLHVLLVLAFICVSQQETLEIVSDLTPETCFSQGLDYSPAGEKTDFPKCKTFAGGTKRCNKYYKPLYSSITYKPTSCTTDGGFGAKQCKGERTTGRCFCFDKMGNRLFGQQWWTKADNMTCACSRKKAEMADAGTVFYNSLHCNSMGNYQPLQCDVVSEQCWCAEEQTGDLTSTVVPKAAMSMLPCYNSLNVGSMYLRQCDSKKFAMKNIANKLSLHGTDVTFDSFDCDEDGAYGRYKVSEGQVMCTWRDNSKIGTWASAPPAPDNLNCYCARDSKIFSDARKTFSLSCLGNGNYKPAQGSGTKMYCIDPDGFRKSDIREDIQEDGHCEGYNSYTENH